MTLEEAQHIEKLMLQYRIEAGRLEQVIAKTHIELLLKETSDHQTPYLEREDVTF